MVTRIPTEAINVSRLEQKMAELGVDAIVSAVPENTYYLSGVFIRTQIACRDRLAIVVWPAGADPTYIVCNIEESLAQQVGWIQDIRTYVEFAESPIAKLVEVLEERGLADKKLGFEEKFLTIHYYNELRRLAPKATLVAVDRDLEWVQAAKTPLEIEKITHAYRETEEMINEAWTASRAGDTEKMVSDKMLIGLLNRGADSLRHISLTAAENSVMAHVYPSDRRLQTGEHLVTDVGGNFYGFSSDMARSGAIGKVPQQILDEYARYREVYVKLLHFIKPGVTAAEVYNRCKAMYEAAGMAMTFPHCGHSLWRLAGHQNPILEPTNPQVLEPGMLLAIEPTYRAAPDRRYHIEDLILLTRDGNEILTNWQATERMIQIPG